jgi:hypothetical protein
MTESLLLKWGTIKGWDNFTEKSQEIVRRYFADGMSMSCALEKPDEARKLILCELIDQLDGEIQNDWSGEMMSKDEAKKYVMEYGRPAPVKQVGKP